MLVPPLVWQRLLNDVMMMLQVLGATSPTFKLHIQPGQQEARRKGGFAQAISHAGHGMGLQVFPGSIGEVVNVSHCPKALWLPIPAANTIIVEIVEMFLRQYVKCDCACCNKPYQSLVDRL